MKHTRIKNWNLKKYFTKATIMYFIGIIVLSTLTYGTYSVLIHPQNCTHEYVVYKDLKKYSTIDELKNELNNLGIEYNLSNGVITFNNYHLFQFDYNNAGSCTIVTKDDTLKAFEVVDNAELDKVEIKGTLNSEGEMDETVLYKTHEVKVAKTNNEYFRIYKKNIYSLIGFAIADIGLLIFLICKIKKISKNQIPYDTTYN